MERFSRGRADFWISSLLEKTDVFVFCSLGYHVIQKIAFTFCFSVIFLFNEQQKSEQLYEMKKCFFFSTFNALILPCGHDERGSERRDRVDGTKMSQKKVERRTEQSTTREQMFHYWRTVKSQRNTELYPGKLVRMELIFLKIKAQRQSIH